MSQTLYLRLEHGGHQVDIKPGKGRAKRLTVHRRPKRTYPSWKRLATDLYGPRRRVSFDWYFRLGRYAPPRVRPIRSILDFLRPGVDLQARSHEVQKLMNKSFGDKLVQWGLDPEEVLSEVLLGITARNNGPGAWDPSRGAFSTYVTMVCRCVISNMRKRQRRRDHHEQVGLVEVQGGAFVMVPVSRSRHAKATQDDAASGLAEAIADLSRWIDWTIDEPEHLTDLAQDIIPLVYQGMRRGEIAEHLQIPPSRVGQALRILRQASSTWQEQIA